MLTAKERMLSDLLDRLYGQAADKPHDWEAMAEALARYVGGAHGQFFARRPSANTAPVATLTGIDPKCVRDYLDEHGASDPRLGLILANAGRVFRDHEVEPAGFGAHPITRDFLDRLGLRRQLGLVWNADGDEVFTVGVLRPARAGPFGAEASARLALVAPHLVRAYRLHGAMAKLAAVGATIRAQLETSPRATVLVDFHGRPLFFNSAAENLVRQGVLTRAGKRLSLGDPAAARPFAAALDAAGRASALAGAPSVVAVMGGTPVIVSWSDPRSPSAPGKRFVVRAFPLVPAHPFRSVAEGATIAVLAADLNAAPGGPATPEASVLADVFRLTDKEARLAAFVGTGLSLEDAAREFGVARNTVRAQLQAVFEKTETRRQAELVHVVQGIAGLKL